MEIKNNLLYDDAGKQVSYKATPNRGGALVPTYLIMHYTADTNPGSTIGWFLNTEAKASAHLLIDRDGNITQFAPFNVVCWHAGQSQWKNIIGLNSHSVGIEMTNGGKLSKVGEKYICPTDQGTVKNTDVITAVHKNEHTPAYWQIYTPKQLEVAAKVTDALNRYFAFRDILGHDDIAPGRKTDPGPAFDMLAFKKAANFTGNVDTYKTTVNVNLRSGPGTNFAITTVLPGNTIVQKLAESGAWAQIYVPASKLTGFINSNYMKS